MQCVRGGGGGGGGEGGAERGVFLKSSSILRTLRMTLAFEQHHVNLDAI